MEGTYALPEAQRDRFMARVSMGYPSAAAEMALLENHARQEPIDTLQPVADANTVRRLILTARQVYASDAVKEYVVAIARATRASHELRLGASPRAALQLLRASKAQAATNGRDHVLPDDVQALGVAVLAHRLLLSPDAQLARRTADDVCADILATVPVPRARVTG
jgi:MoxR-like ATPase